MKGEDILERALVPEEGWLGQREETRLFGGGAQTSTVGRTDLQGWDVNLHGVPPLLLQRPSYSAASEHQAGLQLHDRGEGSGREDSS